MRAEKEERTLRHGQPGYIPLVLRSSINRRLSGYGRLPYTEVERNICYITDEQFLIHQNPIHKLPVGRHKLTISILYGDNMEPISKVFELGVPHPAAGPYPITIISEEEKITEPLPKRNNLTEIQAPLNIRALLINQPYSSGTILGGIKWSSDYRDLRIIFDNSTENDYQDIDMIVGPDFPKIIIAAIGQISNIPNVTFHNPVMQAYLNPNGQPDFKFDKKTGNILGANFIFVAPHEKVEGKTPLRVYPNYYRIRCEKLPRHMILEITLAIPIQDIAKQKGKINTVWINGQYNGGTQIQNIDQNIPVSN